MNQHKQAYQSLAMEYALKAAAAYEAGDIKESMAHEKKAVKYEKMANDIKD